MRIAFRNDFLGNEVRSKAWASESAASKPWIQIELGHVPGIIPVRRRDVRASQSG